MKKRILSLLLTLVMILGMISATAMTASAASAAIPNLHRGVLADCEDTNYVYWDPVEGAEKYTVKVTNGTSTSNFNLTDVNSDMSSPSCKFVFGDGYVVSGSEDYYYAKAGEYKVQITATKKYGSIEQEIASSEISFTIKEKEQISQDGTANTVSITSGKPGDAVKMTVGKSSVADIGTAITQKMLEKANYEVAYVEGVDWLSSSWNKDGELELVGTIPENCPNGEYIAYIGLKSKASNAGFVIECTVLVKEALNISEIVFKTPNVIPTYWEIYDPETTYLKSVPDMLTIDTATGSFTDVNWIKYIDFQNDSEGDRWFHNSLMKYTASGTATDVTKQIHTFTEGKYAIVWDVPLFYTDPDDNELAFAENVKAYVGSSDYPVDKIEFVSATYIRCYRYYYVYDVKPEIRSVTVNGTSVADGGTFTANSGSVAIKTTYDSTLSQALQDYGCSVKSYAKYYLNGEALTLSPVPAIPNGNGTSTLTYNRTLNGGDVLTVESWMEVTWPDGSTDRVDEYTTVVECRSLGFASQNPKMPGESTTAARETLRLGASKTYSFTAEALSANSPYSLTTGIVIYNETEQKTVYSSSGNALSRSLDISDYITETGKYYVMEEIVLLENGERIDALRHIFPLTIVKEALPSVAVNVTVPIFEGNPSDAVLSSESQNDCTITKTEWYQRDVFGNETKIDSTHRFEVNGRYRCYVTFAPVAGTYFSPATAVYINGEKATLDGSIGDTATYYVTYDVDTDNLPVLLTDDSFPKTGSSMTVDIDAMAELSEDIMEAYFNGEISVEWYVDGTRVESAPTSDFGEKLEVKAEYIGKTVYAKFIYGSESLTGKTYTITGEVCTIGFDANGGSNADAHSATVITKGAAYTLPECEFTAPAGYVFKAWEVNSVEYAPGTQITVNDNVTAVAVWKVTALTGSTTDGIKVEVKDLIGSATLMVAQYDGGRMVAVQTVAVTADGPYTMDRLTHKDGYTYKAFLVNSTTYAPLCEAKPFS